MLQKHLLGDGLDIVPICMELQLQVITSSMFETMWQIQVKYANLSLPLLLGVLYQPIPILPGYHPLWAHPS